MVLVFKLIELAGRKKKSKKLSGRLKNKLCRRRDVDSKNRKLKMLSSQFNRVNLQEITFSVRLKKKNS